MLQTGSSEGAAVAERGSTAMLHQIHGSLHSARDFESTVAQGFVKHGFKVQLHRVVDGPLQASRCLVSRTPCVYTRYILGLSSLYSSDNCELPVPRLYTTLQVQDRPAEPLPYPQTEAQTMSSSRSRDHHHDDDDERCSVKLSFRDESVI